MKMRSTLLPVSYVCHLHQGLPMERDCFYRLLIRSAMLEKLKV